jgi:hypothetical protein
MFFKESDVNGVLTCVACLQILDDPRMLPCAASACNKCIQAKIQSSNKNLFDCTSCQDTHKPLTEKGFPLNIHLAKLENTKAEEVYKNKNLINLKEKLAEIKVKCEELKYNCEELKNNFSNTDDKISQYCIALRNQVDLETEQLIEQVHQFNEGLIKKINIYEKECTISYKDQIGTKVKEYEFVVSKTNEFMAVGSKYLSEDKPEATFVNNLLDQADVHLEKLILREKLLKGVMFDGKLMEFVKNKTVRDQSLLGEIALKRLMYEPMNFKELKFDDQIVTKYHSHFSFFKLENGNNVVFYIDTSFNLNMVTFDNN